MEIGFIGLGIMGSRMAANLQKAGHQLRVYNRDDSKCTALVNKGAIKTTSPKAAAEGVDVVVTMLADPVAVNAVASGDQGVLAGLSDDAVWIDCSTVGPTTSTNLAKTAQEKGKQFLEAPVTGSKAAAESGDLTFLVGGPAALVESYQMLFDIMGSKTVHVGDYGSAGALKLVLNHLLGVSMAAFSEGLVLGKALGIPTEKLFETLLGTPLVPPYLAVKKGKIVDGDLDADFPLKWMNKDLALVANAAYENNVAMPLANNAKEIYRLAQLHGHGEHDFAAIFQYLSAG